MTDTTLLTWDEAGATLKLSKTSLRRLMNSGDLEWVKIGRERRILGASVDLLLARLLAGEEIVMRRRSASEDLVMVRAVDANGQPVGEPFEVPKRFVPERVSWRAL